MAGKKNSGAPPQIATVEDRAWNHRRGDYDTVRTITAGTARRLLGGMPLDGDSRVNKSLTKAQAIDILRKGIESVADDAPIRVGVAKNVLREGGYTAAMKEVG